MINKEILGLKDIKLPLLPFSDDLPQWLEATQQENSTDNWLAWHITTTRSQTAINEWLLTTSGVYRSVMQHKIYQIKAWLLLNHFERSAIQQELNNINQTSEREKMQQAIKNMWPCINRELKQKHHIQKRHTA